MTIYRSISETVIPVQNSFIFLWSLYCQVCIGFTCYNSVLFAFYRDVEMILTRVKYHFITTYLLKTTDLSTISQLFLDNENAKLYPI